MHTQRKDKAKQDFMQRSQLFHLLIHIWNDLLAVVPDSREKLILCWIYKIFEQRQKLHRVISKRKSENNEFTKDELTRRFQACQIMYFSVNLGVKLKQKVCFCLTCLVFHLSDLFCVCYCITIKPFRWSALSEELCSRWRDTTILWQYAAKLY